MNRRTFIKIAATTLLVSPVYQWLSESLVFINGGMKINMNGSMDMLRVISLYAPKGPVPAGMKVASLAGANRFQIASASSVLSVGGFTLWPMSYIDNRASVGMVMYDPKWQIVNVLEKPGIRAIHTITFEGSGKSGSALFWGQDNQKVTMSLNDVCLLLCRS